MMDSVSMKAPTESGAKMTLIAPWLFGERSTTKDSGEAVNTESTSAVFVILRVSVPSLNNSQIHS